VEGHQTDLGIDRDAMLDVTFAGSQHPACDDFVLVPVLSRTGRPCWWYLIQRYGDRFREYTVPIQISSFRLWLDSAWQGQLGA
jgi:hypothetical protein